jgi:hypothetical protein
MIGPQMSAMNVGPLSLDANRLAAFAPGHHRLVDRRSYVRARTRSLNEEVVSCGVAIEPRGDPSGGIAVEGAKSHQSLRRCNIYRG